MQECTKRKTKNIDIKGDVQIGKDKKISIDPSVLPMNLTINELAEICCSKDIEVIIILQEKDK